LKGIYAVVAKRPSRCPAMAKQNTM